MKSTFRFIFVFVVLNRHFDDKAVAFFLTDLTKYYLGKKHILQPLCHLIFLVKYQNSLVRCAGVESPSEMHESVIGDFWGQIRIFSFFSTSFNIIFFKLYQILQ